MKRLAMALASTLVAGAGLAVSAEMAGPDPHHGHMAAASAPPAAVAETRQLVRYPEPLRLQTLANMRDHLSTLGQIQAALAAGAFDQASELAERRLGMSSLEMHGASEVAAFMPQGMQDAGTAMHRAASRFAIVAKDASATGELRPALASLAGLTESCVACHAAYRLQ